MPRSSKSRTTKKSAAKRPQGLPRKDQLAQWREGLSRLKEEGRLLWLLGEGLDAMLEARADEVAPEPDQIAAVVADWARQAMAVRRPLVLGKGVVTPVQRTATAREAPLDASLRLADTLLDSKPLSGLWCPVLWMGSREWGLCGLVTVVLGVGGDGRKRVLSVRMGSVREQGVVAELLSDLTARGLSVDGGLLIVTEGSRTVDEALHQAWGNRVLVSHCRRSVVEEVASHVVEDQRAAVCRQMTEAWTLAPGQAAEALHQLSKRLQRSAPGAAERLQRSIAPSLVVDRLEAPAPLKDRLLSVGSVTQAFERAHAWGGHGGGELPDLLVGLSCWLARTRRLIGWQHLGLLAHAIQETVKALAPTENENCTPNSKSGAAKGTRR